MAYKDKALVILKIFCKLKIICNLLLYKTWPMSKVEECLRYLA